MMRLYSGQRRSETPRTSAMNCDAGGDESHALVFLGRTIARVSNRGFILLDTVASSGVHRAGGQGTSS
jgi:hypothetical protein